MGITGNLPDKIIFVCGTWINEDAEDDGLIEVYPVAKENKKRLESARNWAKGSYHHRQKKRTDKIEEIEFDNTKGFENIQVRNLEIRGEGGRAYKIIVDNKYLTDMREDELMEVITGPGIREGGILNGKFAFGTVGSQNKVMLIGGNVHTELQKYKEAKTLKKIPIKELEFGALYTNASGNKKEIYLGECKMLKISTNNFHHNYSHNQRQTGYGKITFEIEKGKHCWTSYYRDDKWEDGFKDQYFITNFKKSHSMVKKLKRFEKVSLEKIRVNLIKANLEQEVTSHGRISLHNIPFRIEEKIYLPNELIERYKHDYQGADISELEKLRNDIKVSKFSVISK